MKVSKLIEQFSRWMSEDGDRDVIIQEFTGSDFRFLKVNGSSVAQWGEDKEDNIEIVIDSSEVIERF